MENVKNLFKLEFLLYKKARLDKYKKNKWSILSILFVFAFSVLISTFLSISLTFIPKQGMGLGGLSFLLFLGQLILFFYSIGILLKEVYFSKDKVMLSNLPVSKWQIYLSKTLLCFIKTYIINFFVSLPIIVCYGIVYGLPFTYFLVGILAFITIPLIPFALASLLATPIAYVQNWLRNKAIVKLAMSIIVTLAGFYLYSLVIFNIADVIFLDNQGGGNIFFDIVNIFENPYFPSTWLSGVLQGGYLAQQIPLYFGISIVLPVISTLLSAVCYKTIFVQFLVQKIFSKRYKSTNKIRKPFATYFFMEIKELFRNSTYAFTYFGMAVAMPIMVFVCNTFMLGFAVERLGENIIFGTTLLVVLIFVSMICSPSASFISKEGNSFWILRTNPNGIRIPLLAKSFVGVVVSICALVTTIILIVSFGFIDIWSGLIILGFALIYIFGLISCGLTINLARPNLFDGEKENNNNLLLLMFIGFLFSLLIGVVVIVLSFSVSHLASILTALGVIVLFAVSNLLILLKLYPKLYARMEVA